jgi:hypothetical protein
VSLVSVEVVRLEAHERECAIRYQSVQEKLDGLDKRLWRLEAMMMASTLAVVGAAVGLFFK